MIRECQRLQRSLDPNDHGDSERVNAYCELTNQKAENITIAVYMDSGKYGWFDITHTSTDSFPSPYASGFLNQHWVQAALGVPVNHTFISAAVGYSFTATGDMAKGGSLEDIAYILDHGVRVAMMYGDRDYACNWVGGEAASLKVPYGKKEKFAEAGYTALVISPVHSGGLVRQYGNFSFTRVYQAGHLVPAYQGEVAYEIFMRAIRGKDVATGGIDLEDFATESGREYSTDGPSDAWWMKSEILPAPANECYVFDMGRCTDQERDWIFDGTAIVKDWIVVGREDDKSAAVSARTQPQVQLVDDR